VTALAADVGGMAANTRQYRKTASLPWSSEPAGSALRSASRVNIRRGKDGNAKSSQVRQVLDAIAKLEAEENEESDDDA
jgi:hypothetical protein